MSRVKSLVRRPRGEAANAAEDSQPGSSRILKLGRRLPELPVRNARPGADWVEANPKKIERALARACKRPTGGWYVLGGRRRLFSELGSGATTRRVLGKEYVLWLHKGDILAAPNACPHMGARLDGYRVKEGRLRCPWHGLELGREGRGGWQCAPVHDDGVLVWLRLEEQGQAQTGAPVLSPRPDRYLDGVIELVAECEPRDILANRLDPWHGVHLHPYGFAELEVTNAGLGGDEDRMLLRVAKRVFGPLCVEVDISFHAETSRSIVMTIVDGEGKGSVVETHATPLGDVDGKPRCLIVEATLAASDRPGFAYAEKISAIFRPLIRRSAMALWRDDLPYAERLFELRR